MAKPKTVYYESAGGVVIDQGRMLLLDRPNRGEMRLPKGHIDAGESPEIAALREVTEESGYADLEITHSLGDEDVEFDYNGKHVVRTEHYFVMRLRSDRTVRRDAKDEEQFRVAWTPLAEAADRLTYPAEQARARAAIEYVQGS
jgi:8-oxo-dGTP pyrophosphatase MutT (NUDIX family)